MYTEQYDVLRKLINSLKLKVYWNIINLLLFIAGVLVDVDVDVVVAVVVVAEAIIKILHVHWTIWCIKKVD